MRASEELSIEGVEQRLDNDAAWVSAIMRRVTPYVRTEREPDAPLRVLDVGAAQGRAVAALLRMGVDAVGVEPHDGAIERSRELAERLHLPIEVRSGTFESIPFDDSSFDVVLAMSVLEHVDDPDQGFREARRVLRPGGVLWFDSASSMCPRQAEIAHVPLFGWYPLALKRRIMSWAVTNRPAWVGHTDRPAIHWWTPRSANRRLRAAGFTEVVDRWQLRQPDEDSGLARALVRGARSNALVRFAGNVAVTGCSYLAR